MNRYHISKVKPLKNLIQLHQKMFKKAILGKSPRNLKKYISLLAIIILLNACAGMERKVLTEEKRSSIQSVSINPDVHKPKNIDFDFEQRGTGGSSWGDILKSAAASGLATASAEIRFRNVYRYTGISIVKILKEQFEMELKNSGLFGSIVPSGGDAEFRFSILNYGFREKTFTRNYLKPHLRVKASLVEPDETILWDTTKYSYGSDKVIPSYFWSELYDNPELMREALVAAAKAVSVELVKSLKGK